MVGGELQVVVITQVSVETGEGWSLLVLSPLFQMFPSS